MTKRIAVALTAAAVAAMSVVTVSAATLGSSDLSSTDFEVIAGEEVVADVAVDDGDMVISVAIPANVLEAGNYTFYADTVADDTTTAAFEAEFNSDLTTVVEMYFTDENGDTVDVKDVAINIDTTASYDAAFVQEEDDSFTNLNAEVTESGLSFVAPHFSTYVLADLADENNGDGNNGGDTNNGDDTNGGNTNNGDNTNNDNNNTGKGDSTTATGDNSAATIAVFGVMGVAALGTAIASSKVKKSEK